MFNKSGYEAIPDIETAKGGRVHETVVLKPQDLYPEANSEEAELLGTLDSIINGSSLELAVPKVDSKDVSPGSPNFCMALVWPLFAALVLGFAARFTDGSVAGGGTVDRIVFPCLAVFLVWLNSAVSISYCMVSQASLAIVSADQVKGKVAKCLQNGVNIVEARVADVKGKLDSVVQGMRHKISALRDPALDITDLDDALTSLDSALVELDASAKNAVEATVVFDDIVPSYLRSNSKYWWNIVLPVLLLCFAFQAVFLGGASLFVFIVDHKSGFIHEPITISRLLVTISDKSLYAADKDIEVQIIEDPVESGMPISALVFKVGVLVQSFIMAVIQIAIVYFCTGKAYVAGLVNESSACIGETAGRVARVQGLYATTDSILVGKMSILKKQLLKTILSLKMIERVDASIATTAEKAGGFGWFGIGKGVSIQQNFDPSFQVSK